MLEYYLLNVPNQFLEASKSPHPGPPMKHKVKYSIRDIVHNEIVLSPTISWISKARQYNLHKCIYSYLNVHVGSAQHHYKYHSLA